MFFQVLPVVIAGMLTANGILIAWDLLTAGRFFSLPSKREIQLRTWLSVTRQLFMFVTLFPVAIGFVLFATVSLSWAGLLHGWDFSKLTSWMDAGMLAGVLTLGGMLGNLARPKIVDWVLARRQHER